MMSTGRIPLHYVFKLAEREKTIKFYTETLGMTILRHEEFDSGCEATCNGPYAGKWSKTMIGYGPEDDHYVIELTYNYGIEKYDLGNDFIKITVESTEAKNRILGSSDLSFTTQVDGSLLVQTPSSPGYSFHIKDGSNCVTGVTLGSSDIQATANFWSKLLKMDIVEQTSENVKLSYLSLRTFILEFVRLAGPVEKNSSEGRIAFSCPKSELLSIQKTVEDAGYPVKNRLVALDTPGKATVQVVILLDPNMHEICFVGDEAYRELSKVDPQAGDLLYNAVKEDRSLDARK